MCLVENIMWRFIVKGERDNESLEIYLVLFFIISLFVYLKGRCLEYLFWDKNFCWVCRYFKNIKILIFVYLYECFSKRICCVYF